MIRSWTFALLISCMSGGCATYSVSELPAPDRAKFPFSTSRDGVVVGVDAYGEGARQKAYLGDDFSPVGILPILVLVENGGATTIQIDAEQVALRLPDGTVEKEVAPDVVFTFRGHSGPQDTQLERAGAFGIIGALGALAAAGAVAESRATALRERWNDFGRKSLQRGAVQPGERRQGFVYFWIPRKASAYTEAVVQVLLSDPSGSKGLELSVPLKNVQLPKVSP